MSSDAGYNCTELRNVHTTAYLFACACHENKYTQVACAGFIREHLKGCLTCNTAFNAEIWVVKLRVRAESHTSVPGPPSNHEVQQYRMIEVRDHFTKEFGQIWNLQQRVRITDTQPLHCKRKHMTLEQEGGNILRTVLQICIMPS